MEHDTYDLSNQLEKTRNMVFDLYCLTDKCVSLSIDDFVYVRLSEIDYRFRNYKIEDYNEAFVFLENINSELEALKCDILLISFNSFNSALI